jgi:SAM-dependent methyltransferase
VVDGGCGNGWLANLIAGIEGCRVVALDPNEVELAQAERVFGGRPNLRFLVADVRDPLPVPERPDVVVLASVLQYVPDLPGLITHLAASLAPGGELHILDSPFYRTAELPAARERSRRYYRDLGVPEMAEAYRHHDWRTLEPFEPTVLYRPDSLRVTIEGRLLRRARSPFPWIRIRPGA